MSKKKATMSLKDFHGGSIPSDLRLPSAPGVTMRSVDRPGFDRQMSWGNSSGRPDHRIRPASAGSVRRLDEKTPFLSHSPNIGRNFDEDERKPLDGLSGPRRSIVDETIRAQPSRTMEQPKVDNLSGARVDSRAASIPSPQSGSAASSYAGRVSEVHNTRLNNHTSIGNRSYGSNYPVMGGNAGQTVTGSNLNAWGIRKEAAGIKDPVAWSAPDAKAKLAHASALEKVSSGRWNSKQHVPSPKDAEGESGNDANNVYNKRISNRPESVGVPECHDVSLMMHGERSLDVADGIRGGAREVPGYDRAPSIIHVDSSYNRNTTVTVNGLQSIMPSESSERPKLKLLPRSKPLENVEPLTEYKQSSNHLHVEDSYVVHEPKNPLQSGTAGPMVGDRAVERPKLNLKPRSLTLEQLEGNSESKRRTVFGGARPRELVLKERGIEDDVSSYESHSPLRVKESTPKVDTFTHVPPVRYHDKAETNPTVQRTAKHYSDRRDHQLDVEKIDPHRRNNRPNEIRRNNWDIENENRSQQQKQERPPSPDTWRRPAEPDAPPMRHGKVATAVELAQVFSKSVSDPTVADRFSGSRGVPGCVQVPFSRLTGPTPRPQVNGY